MKILRKLTRKNLTLNRTRTLVTIMGIMLSTALITVVACTATGFQQSLINLEIERTGDYDFRLDGNYTAKDIEKLNANRNIANTYYTQTVGISKFDTKSKYRPYVYVEGYNKEAFGNCFKIDLQKGRLPENADEIILSPAFNKNSEKEYKPGDKITFEFGNRKSASPLEFTDEESKLQSESQYYYYEKNDEYHFEGETFEPSFKKTYTVVGILSKASGNMEAYDNSACVNAFTIADLNFTTPSKYTENHIYADIKESSEKDYIEVVSEIFGVDSQLVKDYSDGQLDDAGYETLMNGIKKRGFTIYNFDFNHDLLAYKGYSLSEKNNSIIFGLLSLVIGVIILSSIFIIRNSFAISITEKTKLYGMLSSVGATPRQIRQNVLYEGFVLGLIGIPMGIILGIGVSYLLILLCNYILAEILNGSALAFRVSFLSIAASIVLGAITIFFSALSSSIRASKISPIEAIRSNNDVNIKNKERNKSYKTPKFIKKLFGMGGSIAWKNLKRSRKKYRTTVISIVVSVAVFISVYSFVQYGVEYSTKYAIEIDYNMIMFFNNYQSSDENEYNNRITSFEKIAESDYVTDYSLTESCYYYNFKLKANDFSKSLQGNSELYVVDFDNADAYYNPSLVALDDKSYNTVLKLVGKSKEELKDKAIVLNLIDTSSPEETDKKLEKLLNSPVGMEINGENTYDSTEPGVQSTDQNSKIKLTIGAEISKESIAKRIAKWRISNGSLIVPRDWYKKHISFAQSTESFALNSSDPDKTEQFISDMNLQDLNLINFDKEARQMRSIILVIQIFVYGFIIVISLIGITNIFNTITTNISFRKKEFAMLRSIGMTNKEFKRMVNLESIFYTVKSLLIGLPLGILGSFLTYNVFANNEESTAYIFPFFAVITSTITVLAIVWLIMRFSISKIKNQNIIETIRNDNI